MASFLIVSNVLSDMIKSQLMLTFPCVLRAISTVFHNNNPFIEFSNFLTSVVEFNGEFEKKKKK